jgi:D-amino-acid dehydrogenase
MAFERGYHMHYGWLGDAGLSRPVYDTAAACVLSPMSEGVRLTTGVELTDRDAPDRHDQVVLAETAVRSVLPLGARLQATPWRGSRPTLPDSRPAIGPATGLAGLWLAFGHQHIGFSTGPGTAALLGAMVDNEALPIDAKPFSPGRFGL